MATKPNPLTPVVLNVQKAVSLGVENFLQNICRVSINDTALDAGKGEWVNKENYTDIVADATSATAVFCRSFFATNANGKLFILEAKPVAEDIGAGTPAQSTGQVITNFVKTSPQRFYIYSAPNSLYVTKDNDFVALIKGSTGVTDSVYFMIDITLDDNIDSTTSAWADYKGTKSVMGMYSAVASTESISGATAGIIASKWYSLNEDRLLTKLQWKNVDGIITPDDAIGANISKALNNNGCTWVQSQAGIAVLLGCSMADGTAFEEYYAMDNLFFHLINDTTLMFINGSNSNSRVTFDQSGVTHLITTLNNTTNKLVRYGCVNRFGSGVDDKGELEGEGTWGYIPFNKWKQNSPEMYAQRIYDGASMIVDTTKFMLQVVLNITVE